jgi:hypothetical protein
MVRSAPIWVVLVACHSVPEDTAPLPEPVLSRDEEILRMVETRRLEIDPDVGEVDLISLLDQARERTGLSIVCDMPGWLSPGLALRPQPTLKENLDRICRTSNAYWWVEDGVVVLSWRSWHGDRILKCTRVSVAGGDLRELAGQIQTATRIECYVENWVNTRLLESFAFRGTACDALETIAREAGVSWVRYDRLIVIRR